MMVSCWFIPIGLFIFAWTSYPELSWVGPALGGFPVGFGFIFLYNAANNYLVDSYQHQAASALAAKTFLRSFWGAAVVLFTNQMYVVSIPRHLPNGLLLMGTGTIASATSGQAPSSVSSVWAAVQYRSYSTSKARPSEDTRISPIRPTKKIWDSRRKHPHEIGR